MQIGIDGLLLWGQYSGVERSIARMATTLARLDQTNRYTIHVPFDCEAEALAAAGVEVRRAPFRGAQKLTRILWQQGIFPGVLAREGADVLFAPGYVLPLRWRGPSVLFVYDIIAIARPDLASRTNAWHYRALLPRSVRRATRVAVPTEHVRRQVIEQCGVMPSRVTVVPLGVSPRFQRVEDPARQAEVRLCCQLPERFVLTLGNLEPKKNLPRVLEAYDILRRAGIRQGLVIAGQPAWGAAALRESLARCASRADIVLPGYIADEDLPVLYSMADALVFPSLTEGFGLPPLEAMACGTPVVVADVPPFDETLGDAAVRVAPEDPQAIAAGIRQVLEDPLLAARLREAGREQAALFTWERCASLLAKLFDSAVTAHG
ncbi:MAG TPA: glycosyltransferase family 4 protein [Armatimonadetes bacterium]|jgi:glycosyltransferase involved in cell wall biosynthesis|nr:glycosyltransferase family 4 protein [Armatimonadota bacterium]